MNNEPEPQTPPAGQTPEPQASPEPPVNQGEPPAAAKTFTQDEMNAIIARETKKAVQKAKDEAAADAAKAQMTEAEKLKAERDEATAKVTEAEARANKRIVTAEAKAALARAGVKAESAEFAFNALGDLTDAIGTDGEPDTAAIKARVDALLAAAPQFAGDPAAPRGGAQMNGGAGIPDIEQMSQAEFNKWYRENMNTG